MILRTLSGLALAITLIPARESRAQVRLDVRVGLPVAQVEVTPAPPPVVAQPQVVVEEPAPIAYDEEIYYGGGAYYCYHQGGWYRRVGPRWAFVRPTFVPRTIVRVEPDHYRGSWGRGGFYGRHYFRGHAHRHGHWRRW